jgi:hypothetical protein
VAVIVALALAARERGIWVAGMARERTADFEGADLATERGVRDIRFLRDFHRFSRLVTTFVDETSKTCLWF